MRTGHRGVLRGVDSVGDDEACRSGLVFVDRVAYSIVLSIDPMFQGYCVPAMKKGAIGLAIFGNSS